MFSCCIARLRSIKVRNTLPPPIEATLDIYAEFELPESPTTPLAPTFQPTFTPSSVPYEPSTSASPSTKTIQLDVQDQVVLNGNTHCSESQSTEIYGAFTAVISSPTEFILNARDVSASPSMYSFSSGSESSAFANTPQEVASGTTADTVGDRPIMEVYCPVMLQQPVPRGVNYGLVAKRLERLVSEVEVEAEEEEEASELGWYCVGM